MREQNALHAEMAEEHHGVAVLPLDSVSVSYTHLNLEGALDGIFQKSADLVLGNAHLRAFRMVAHEVDSVKFALRRAEAAACLLYTSRCV